MNKIEEIIQLDVPDNHKYNLLENAVERYTIADPMTMLNMLVYPQEGMYLELAAYLVRTRKESSSREALLLKCIKELGDQLSITGRKLQEEKTKVSALQQSHSNIRRSLDDERIKVSILKASHKCIQRELDMEKSNSSASKKRALEFYDSRPAKKAKHSISV